MNALKLYNINSIDILEKVCNLHSIKPTYQITCDIPIFDYTTRTWDHFGILHKCVIILNIGNDEIREEYQIIDRNVFNKNLLKESLSKYKKTIKLMAAEKMLLKLKEIEYFNYNDLQSQSQ